MQLSLGSLQLDLDVSSQLVRWPGEAGEEMDLAPGSSCLADGWGGWWGLVFQVQILVGLQSMFKQFREESISWNRPLVILLEFVPIIGYLDVSVDFSDFICHMSHFSILIVPGTLSNQLWQENDPDSVESGALRDVAMGHHRPSPGFRWFPAMRTACCEVTFWSCNLRQKMVVVELTCNWMTCHGPKMPRLNGHGPWNGAAWKVNSDFEMFSWKDQRLGTRMSWFDIHQKLTYHICFIWFWGGGCLFKHHFFGHGTA